MAYNKANYYERIIEIQNIVLRKKREDEDMYYKTIFWEFVRPKYKISYRTFYNYLRINAKYELKKLQKNDK